MPPRAPYAVCLAPVFIDLPRGSATEFFSRRQLRRAAASTRYFVRREIPRPVARSKGPPAGSRRIPHHPRSQIRSTVILGKRLSRATAKAANKLRNAGVPYQSARSLFNRFCFFAQINFIGKDERKAGKKDALLSPARQPLIGNGRRGCRHVPLLFVSRPPPESRVIQ